MTETFPRWTDETLYMLRQTGGDPDPRTGQVRGLSIRRLAAYTGLTRYEVSKRICRYTGWATP